jgi:hypothetical protein
MRPLGSRRNSGSPLPPGAQGGRPLSGPGSRPGLTGFIRRVVGKLRRQRRTESAVEIPPSELLGLLLKLVERHFGREMCEKLLQYIRTRCEEKGCGNDFEYACAYCSMRLCKVHAVFGEGQLVYCRLHADPNCRMVDIFLVRRDL